MNSPATDILGLPLTGLSVFSLIHLWAHFTHQLMCLHSLVFTCKVGRLDMFARRRITDWPQSNQWVSVLASPSTFRQVLFVHVDASPANEIETRLISAINAVKISEFDRLGRRLLLRRRPSVDWELKWPNCPLKTSFGTFLSPDKRSFSRMYSS